MKKMIFAIFFIISITLVFLFFSSDIDHKNEKFLKSFDIKINPSPVSFEEIKIPEEFDSVYLNYNSIQKEAGFDLLPYKNCDAIRYTYKVLNFPDERRIYANVICVDGNPIGGDISCVELDGFMLPLTYLKAYGDNTIFPQ